MFVRWGSRSLSPHPVKEIEGVIIAAVQNQRPRLMRGSPPRILSKLFREALRVAQGEYGRAGAEVCGPLGYGNQVQRAGNQKPAKKIWPIRREDLYRSRPLREPFGYGELTGWKQNLCTRAIGVELERH